MAHGFQAACRICADRRPAAGDRGAGARRCGRATATRRSSASPARARPSRWRTSSRGCDRPTLVISHNKTLAAQLYSEFKNFFPENAVEYFVSYYDYYQPEAYLPSSDTYIEKDSSINEEIERLRISATSSLVSRRDVIVVASVSCIYGLGSPEDFTELRIELRRGAALGRNRLLERLVDNLYERNDYELKRGPLPRARATWST